MTLAFALEAREPLEVAGVRSADVEILTSTVRRDLLEFTRCFGLKRSLRYRNEVVSIASEDSAK